MKRVVLSCVVTAGTGCGPVVVGFAEDATQGGAGTSINGSEDTTDAGSELPDYVAVGFSHHIVVSFDRGRSWEEIPSTNGTEDLLEGVARGPDRVVAVGGEFSYVSLDGRSWDPATSQLGYARAIVYGGDAFVSVGLDRRSRSYDGAGWIDERVDGESFDLTAIAHGGGRFVAVGKGAMSTSTDGEVWTTTAAPDPPVTAVTYFDGRFVAVGYEGRVRITDDGINVSYDGVVPGPNFASLCVFDGQLVAGVESGAVRTSADGIEWAENALPGGGAIACGPDELVAIGGRQVYRGQSATSFEPVFEASEDLIAVAYTGG